MPRRNSLGPKPRPSPRRRALTVVFVLFIALLIGEGVKDAIDQSPKVGARATATWIAGVEPILVSSSSIAPALAPLERNPAALTRQSVNAAFGALDEVQKGNALSMASLGIKAPSAKAKTSVSSVLDARSRSVAAMKQMIAAATSVPPDHAAAVSSCLDLQTESAKGDAALASLRRLFGAKYSAQFRWVATWASVLPHFAAPGCAALASSLSSNAALSPHRLLKILAISVVPGPVQINGVPNPTTTTTTTTSTVPNSSTTTSTTPVRSGTTSTSTTSTTTTTLPPVTTTTLQIPPSSARSVLPPTSAIAVQIVVQNSGNESEGPILVSVQLVPSSTETGVTRTKTISELGPGGSTYLEFSAIPLRNISGSFVLKVSATALGVPTVERSVTLVRSPK